MTGNEIRRRFLEHFESREHVVLPSAPLVPRGDPSTLFISAGMQPLQPYYQGFSQPPAPRLASCQKCLRTGDIDEVGKTDRHLTFFEMLGNFTPTGAYFKETAIPLAWKLVTGGFEMPADRLRVTIHPTDDEAYEIWNKSAGLPAAHITRLADNWWGLGRGPCGPDSEIWWDRGPDVGCGQPDCVPDHCERFTEFWNLVFPQFDQQEDGSLVPLAHPAIDTGMGLERISYILQGKTNVFETDLLAPIIDRIRDLSGNQSTLSERIVADHVRAACLIMAEQITPSNEGRGYVLRRLIRRATLHSQRMGMRSQVGGLVDVVARVMGQAYPELVQQEELIRAGMNLEATKFQGTLEQGTDQFERIAAKQPGRISGQDAFKLHDTFGFPLELTRELASERGIDVDEEGFRAAMAAQQERSRSSIKSRWAGLRDLPTSVFVGYEKPSLRTRVSRLRHIYPDGKLDTDVQEVREDDKVLVFLDQTPFYAEAGGQVGDTGYIVGPNGVIRVEDTQTPVVGVIAHYGVVERGSVNMNDTVDARIDTDRRHQIARHHSATHLLHKALRETLGENVVQKGSLVRPDYTTFDIPLDRAITADELKRINRRVMDQVRAGLDRHTNVEPYDQAIARGAMHLFGEKYGDVVRVVCFGEWTCELCGGTHVANSADIGPVVIVSESSVGAGLRRIEMVVGESADDLIWRERMVVSDLARSFKATPDQLPERIKALRAQLKEAERERDKLRDQLRSARVGGADRAGTGAAIKHGRVSYVTETVDASNLDELKAYADRYLEVVKSGIVTVVGGGMFVIKVSNDLASQYDATSLKSLFGTGGGRPQLVSGKLTVPAEEAFRRLEEALR
jgi:alanyl-tRNA synthetase